MCLSVRDEEATDGVPQDRAASAGSGGRLVDISEDDLYERSDGDVGARVGPRLVNPPALELPSHFPPGAPSGSDELRRTAEASEIAVELHSQRQSGGEHGRASASGYGARLHGTLQYARTWTVDATANPTVTIDRPLTPSQAISNWPQKNISGASVSILFGAVF